MKTRILVMLTNFMVFLGIWSSTTESNGVRYVKCSRGTEWLFNLMRRFGR